LHSTSCGNGVCSAHLLNKFKKWIPRGKIAYMCGVEGIPGKDKESDVDTMLRELRDDPNCLISCLWDVPIGGTKKSSKTASTEGLSTRLVAHTKNADDQNVVEDVTDNDESMSEVAALAREDRDNRSIPNDKNLFIAVAWAYKGKRLASHQLSISKQVFEKQFEKFLVMVLY